jgi:hypothetical protein
MRKVVVAMIGAVTLLLAGTLSGNAEAGRLTGCCHRNGIWMCGMACGGSSQGPRNPSCCKRYGKWHCPCPPPPQ